MSAVEWSVVLGLATLIVGCLVYAAIRLLNAPHTGLDSNSQRLTRWFGYPRFLQPLLARPMSRREKLGWLIVAVVIAAAVAAT